MDTVYELTKKCCGCGLCVAVCPKDAITMELNNHMYPFVDQDKCIDCSLCRKNCEFSKASSKEKNDVVCFAGRIKDDDVRMSSSSGGTFTVLSDEILNSGGAVCGATFAEDMSVKHIVTDTKEERDRLRGSKYIQSDLSLAYKEMKKVLEAGRKLLFTGTPCQVAAVKKNFIEFSDNLYTIDLICHGVPSTELWRDYINFVEKKYKKKVVNYTFRDKSKSWRAYHPVVTFEDGSKLSDTDVIDSYVELFRYDVSLRESCSACPYADTAREGDITMGDFWGIQNHFPEMDDNRGVSAIMINTSKGKSLLPALENEMWLVPCDIEQIVAGQPNMLRPSKPSNKKDQFAKDYKNLSFDKLLKKYTRVGLKRKMVDFIKKVLKK